MAVQAPEPVPYMEDGYQWFPSFDLLTGESECCEIQPTVVQTLQCDLIAYSQ